MTAMCQSDGAVRIGLAETFPLDNKQKIEQSMACMLEHLDPPLKVTQLASRSGLCSSHYFAVFKRQTGCAPIDYLIGLRFGHFPASGHYEGPDARDISTARTAGICDYCL